ncbi:MAG TPA: insulinase family protein [Candidatus Barnesiella excrementigallinarum]|nr:insulinase family protein [Candidatus Barnesiella excrementigallinarum]
MEEYRTCTLKNGLRLIHKPTQSAVSYCGFTINAGTRDEEEAYSGLAHFVEHTIFKGTTHRRASHILNRMEVVGGELNAYTAKEETVVYSVFPGAHLSRAMQLLGDLIADSQFPEKELSKEREVVADEINSYRDTPSELIYDEFESALFEGCSLGRNILGNVESLHAMTSAVARQFLTDHYTPGNMVFFFMGATPFSQVQHLAERYFGDLSRPTKELPRILKPAAAPFSKTLCLDTHQSHVIIGARAYDLFDKRRRVLLLLNNILGGPGMNSVLNVTLREKRGYVYTVESSVTSYTDTGLFAIYFGTDHRYTQPCIDLVKKELRRLREQRLSPARLAAAKRQFIGQIEVSTDNSENVALALGKSFLRYGHFDSLAEIAEQIESITSDNLLEVANDLLAEEGLSMLIYE